MQNRFADTRLTDWIFLLGIVFLFGLIFLLLMSLFFRSETRKRSQLMVPMRRGWRDTPNTATLITDTYEGA